jgi:hypothetical protein
VDEKMRGEGWERVKERREGVTRNICRW